MGSLAVYRPIPRKHDQPNCDQAYEISAYYTISMRSTYGALVFMSDYLARFNLAYSLKIAASGLCALAVRFMCVLSEAATLMKIRLSRVTEYNGATMGVLCFDDKPEILTLEEAYRANERNISCIPDGKYKVKRVRSARFGITFEVQDVPERSGILFHSGNTVADTEGCILVGQRYGTLAGKPAILNSSKAFELFLKLMNGITEAELIVISAFGGGRVH